MPDSPRSKTYRLWMHIGSLQRLIPATQIQPTLWLASRRFFAWIRPGEASCPTPADIIGFLAPARDLPVSQFRYCLYQLSGEQAVRHFFRVASGLDSMVLGVGQIVNQVKQAYVLASEQGATGRVL